MFVGSEGTLGVINQATIQLMPSPQVIRSLIIPYDELEKAISTVPSLINKKILPLAVEFVPRELIRITEKFLNKNDVTPKENEILFVGSLRKSHWHKGVHILIKSLEIIKKEIPNIKLNIVGDGDSKEYYESLTKELNLTHNVEFHGNKTVDELIKAYQNSAITILPTLNAREGFGIVIIEALACETPVIATNCESGPSEIIENGKNGLLVPVEDVESLKVAMEKLFSVRL